MTAKIKNNKDIFENIEYIELSQNGKSLFTFAGADVNGKSKTEFQKMIGEKLGIGMYYASVKYTNEFVNDRYPIKGIKIGEGMSNNNSNVTIEDIQKLMKDQNKNSDNLNVSSLIDVLKLSYENTISSLKESLETTRKDVLNRDKKIDLLYDEIKSLNKKIADLEIELNSDSGNGNLMDTVMQFMALKNKMTGKNAQMPANLKDIPASAEGIPTEFLQALSIIDFDKVPDEQKQQYLQLFYKFADNLPLKKQD